MKEEEDDYFMASSSADTKPSYLGQKRKQILRTFDEPKSPKRGNQALPNHGDEDVFSPGNKSSLNNSFSAGFSTLS